jgi:hypothetical protein
MIFSIDLQESRSLALHLVMIFSIDLQESRSLALPGWIFTNLGLWLCLAGSSRI